jgi:hypothetical protein
MQQASYAEGFAARTQVAGCQHDFPAIKSSGIPGLLPFCETIPSFRCVAERILRLGVPQRHTCLFVFSVS